SRRRHTRFSRDWSSDVCSSDLDTGYKGRVALYEVMLLKDALKDLILQGASTTELKHEAIRLGMYTLRRSGLNKVNEGMTTLEERSEERRVGKEGRECGPADDQE